MNKLVAHVWFWIGGQLVGWPKKKKKRTKLAHMNLFLYVE